MQENENLKSKTVNLPISKIVPNKGQIEGLPPNPRLIRDERFELLKQSIIDAPEMLELREIIVVEHEGAYVAIGGNMRLRACKDLGFKEVPCKVLPETTPVEKLREYASKDNNSFGQTDWGIIRQWDKEELKRWGMEFGEDVDVSDMTDDDFAEAFDSITDNEAIYPIVPKFDEKHELFIIVSDSEVDSNFLRNQLNMTKMKSYKSGTVSKSNIIHIKDVIDALYGKDSNS